MNCFRKRWIRLTSWSCFLVMVLGVLTMGHWIRLSVYTESGSLDIRECMCQETTKNRTVNLRDISESETQHQANLVTSITQGQDEVFGSKGKHEVTEPWMITLHANRSSVHPIVIYNRVPKCGSSGTRLLIKDLSRIHKFTLVEARVYMKFWLNKEETSRFIQRIKDYPKPLVFERHLHFLDFKSYGMDQPVYINLIRDPIDRLASWYYFRRFQPGHIRKLPIADKIRSYDECVLGNHRECTSPNGQNPEEGYFKIIPFFCGQEPYCREPTEKALLAAINHVKKYYLVVGVVEHYPDFIRVLEQLLPDYFTGALGTYNKTGGATQHKTLYKLPVSDEARLAMRKLLTLEYQFYDFIKRRFKRQVKQILGTG